MVHELYEDIDCSDYRPTVLLAQSNPEDLDKIALASDMCDKYDYVCASKGVEIIDAVNRNCFDAVVLGLKFPDITGATVAYLINEFDPLISLVFLSAYNNNILVSAVHDLNSEFLDKTEEFQDMPALCEKIYRAAIKTPCGSEDRIVTREYRADRRALYSRYNKLSMPSSLMQVAKGR